MVLCISLLRLPNSLSKTSLTFSTQNKKHLRPLLENLILVGDLNSRSACVNEIVIPDEDFTVVKSDDILENDPYLEVLKHTSLTLSRTSQDKTVNCMGRLLIDNCIRNNLVILNGRSFDDANHGKFTCDESSVLCYLLTICVVKSFNV